LTQGKVALIDEEDFLAVDQYYWAAARKEGDRWYAVASIMDADGVKRQKALHRFIMQPPDGVLVDHINGDGLDCRRENMREADHARNMRNRRKSSSSASRFKGVTHRSHGWEATIRTDSGPCYLGCFPTEEDAARAYDAASHYFHGVHGRRNFPNEQPAAYTPRDTLLRASNTSGYRGIAMDKRTGRWRATIHANGKNRNLGFYATAEEAARAYDAKARELLGDKARLNFPD
jgi:hypothetical protein